MTDAKMAVSPDRQLQDEDNFITWRREFEREAKALDVLDVLTGDEKIIAQPKKEAYLFTAQTGETQALTQSNANNKTIMWQADYKAWEMNKDKLKTAGKLIKEWVCEGIQIEIESFKNAKEQYDFINEEYKPTDDRARDLILTQLHNVKLEDFSSTTEYTNKLRQIKADLKFVDFPVTDDVLAISLLNGLPTHYRNFKKQYQWARSSNPKASHDLKYLFKLLRVEEQDQNRIKEEKKAKEATKKKDNTNNNPTGGNNYSRVREDKSHLKCDHCDKTGHIEATYWKAHPEMVPKAIRDRINAKDNDKPKKGDDTGNNKPQKSAALANTDVDKFKAALAAFPGIIHSLPSPDPGKDSLSSCVSLVHWMTTRRARHRVSTASTF